MDNGEQLVSGPPAQPGDAPADQTPTAVTGHVEPVTAQPIEPAAQAVTAEAGTFSDVVNRQAAHRIAAVGVEPVEVHSAVVEVAHGVAPSSLQASEASTSTETTAPVDQQRLIERISKVMSQSTSAGRTTIRLRLYPPELGVVRVEITSVRGEVTARLETSTAEAREILSSNLSALRDGIRAAGVDMREIEVNHREMGVDYGLSNGRHGGAPERNARQFARQSGSEQTLEQGEPPSQAAGAGVLDVLV